MIFYCKKYSHRDLKSRRSDHEAIVIHEMFDAVKEVIKEREDTIIKYVHHSPITKKLICGYCGEHIGRKTWHSNDKENLSAKHLVFLILCVYNY